ncbi:hypothetical protein MPSEU_000729700 [Mayamaea pseudoterrestris]|nr:hypothetical protein MPSEU_000729700 [Mayamaea pseudoterrestris]
MADSTEDLQRKIEALKLQIAQQEAARHSASSSAAVAAVADDEIYDEEEEESYEEEEVIEEDDFESPKQTVASPVPAPSPAPPAPTRVTDHHPSSSHTSHVDKMDQLKKQHGFERPDWATQADAAVDKTILDDAIDHGLKQAGKAGQYQRQVKESTPVIVKGAHVAPKGKVEPRLTWIVVNVNKRKIGKIVMHLYGMDVHTIVDNFTELKGFDLERTDGGLAVVGINPTFVVTAGGNAGLDGKAGVHGVIQEGHDIFQQVMSADSKAVLSIKQAHIYPVKVGKA